MKLFAKFRVVHLESEFILFIRFSKGCVKQKRVGSAELGAREIQDRNFTLRDLTV